MSDDHQYAEMFLSLPPREPSVELLLLGFEVVEIIQWGARYKMNKNPSDTISVAGEDLSNLIFVMDWRGHIDGSYLRDRCKFEFFDFQAGVTFGCDEWKRFLERLTRHLGEHSDG
jgi:hypothetical protein